MVSEANQFPDYGALCIFLYTFCGFLGAFVAYVTATSIMLLDQLLGFLASFWSSTQKQLILEHHRDHCDGK